MRNDNQIKKKSEKSLFFIAVIPDPYFCGVVAQIKEYFRDRYGSGHALKSPAHLTLHMPFKWRDDRLEILHKALKQSVSGWPRFTVSLKNYAAFPPRVVYIDVEANQDLNDLQKQIAQTAREKLKLENSGYKNRGYHPHMTIAFRDLKPSAFREAWAEFQNKELEHQFEVRSVALLKHNGKNWDVYREFKF